MTLYVEPGGTKDLQNSEENLPSHGTFTKAVVHAGTWIFYKFRDFNDDPSNKESWVKILSPSDEQADIENFNGSVYLLPIQTEGIVLFEHAYYGGHRKYYNGDCDNVNPDFPSGQIEGVSSAIVLGGTSTFQVFSKTGGNGVESTLTEGQYPTPKAMNFKNDAVQSIAKLK